MQKGYYFFEPIDESEKAKLKKKMPKDIKKFYEMINKSNKINEVLEVDEKILDKIYSVTVVELQKCFVSRSRIESSYFLLRDVLKVPVDDIDVEMILRAIVVIDALILPYKYLWIKSFPKETPPFIPIVMEGLKTQEDVDVV